MQPHLYIWDKEREKYKKQLTDIKEIFFERIEPVFSNPEEEANKYEDELSQATMQVDCDGNPADDSGDFYEWVMEKSYDKFVLLEVMKYRTLAIWIS